jgi:Acetyltransferase (GNAT) domain
VSRELQRCLCSALEGSSILADVPWANQKADFHQSTQRMRWLHSRGSPACVSIVREGDLLVAAALFECQRGRWFSWKGPSGEVPDPAYLAAILHTIERLGPTTLILRREWEHGDVLRGAGYFKTDSYRTSLVRTDGTWSEILARMSPAVRRRVMRAKRSGMQFLESPKRVGEFYEIYAASMLAGGSPDFATLEELNSLLALERSHLFLACHEGTVAAGSVCFRNEGSLEARYVATRNSMRHLGPMNFVHFMAIGEAARRGLGYLDLSGISDSVSDDKLQRIDRFKKGFGGIGHEYPCHVRHCDELCSLAGSRRT